MSESAHSHAVGASRPGRAWRTRRQGYDNILIWSGGAAALGGVAGVTLVVDPRAAKILAVLPVIVFAFALQPEKLFLGWLFAAPFVQGAAGGQHSGHSIYKLVFLVPPLILLVRMLMGAVRTRGFGPIDALPLLYLAYIIVRLRLAPTTLSSPESSTLRSVYIVVGVGILAYYFTAFGRRSARFPERVARMLLWSGICVSVLGIIDGLTGWNVWHNSIPGDTVHRAVGPFESPEALGAYLGAGVAFALAILVWNGPRSLRLPSCTLIVLSVPALYLSYTRGPILAIVAVVILLALVASRARWRSVLAFAAIAVLLLASWGAISSSAVYKNRLGVTGTVTPRVVLAHVAVELFKKQPIVGWGYATFDQAKFKVPASDPWIVQTTTSHDTFLTVLAELGLVGIALLVIPWIVIAGRLVLAGWHGLVEPWLVGGCVGAALVFAMGALTYDARFFPLITGLPWIALGIGRGVLALRWAVDHAA